MEDKQFESLYPDTTREKEIKEILELIKSGSSAQLIGVPGSGKATILKLLSYNKPLRKLHLKDGEDKFHFVYMDFSEVKKREFFDVIKFMLISLSYSLGEREYFEEQKTINKILKEPVNFKDDLIIFQALKKSIDYLAGDRKISIIFLFDRFDEYILDIDQRFFSNLKVLRNRAKYKFSAVFSLNRPIEQILEPEFFSEYYEFLIGKNVFVSLFDSVGADFRLSYLEKITKKRPDKKLKDELLRLTGGHGKLTRIGYENILGGGKIDNLKSFLLSKNQIKGALFEIWNFLTAEEKITLRKGESTKFLEDINILKNDKTTIPLLKDFIKDLPDQQQNEKITYDANNNEILRGNDPISEKLSASEFRLLKFLLENQGKICSKDEIILNVWKDSKTQEGVTDQALDQIIYRLRKKIENDPNNPRFLQTIKGRGYRLNP